MNKSALFTKELNMAIDALNAFVIKSSEDRKRYDNAENRIIWEINRQITGLKPHSGIFGDVSEILSHPVFSGIIDKRIAGKADGFFRIGNRIFPYENKTNGGRIESLFSERENDNYFVHYVLVLDIPAGKVTKRGKQKPAQHRRIDKVYFVSDFLDILEECNAVKYIEHKGKLNSDRERAIVATSKKMYNKLLTAGMDFNRLEKVNPYAVMR